MFIHILACYMFWLVVTSIMSLMFDKTVKEVVTRYVFTFILMTIATFAFFI